MTQRSTLLHVASLVIDRVLAKVDPNTDLCEALNRAYPFGDDPVGREVWIEVLLRNAVEIDPNCMDSWDKSPDTGPEPAPAK